jgi:hypothetical protein
MGRSNANTRYARRLFAATVVFFVAVFGGKYMFNHGLLHGGWVWLFGLLPGIGVLLSFYAVGMLIVEEKDEFLRALIVRQALIAAAFALSLVTIWGALQSFGVIKELDAYLLSMFWFFGLGVGSVVNRLTRGTWGGGC